MLHCVYLCNVCKLNVFYIINLYICTHMQTCKTSCEFRYTGGSPSPSTLRGFEHLTAIYLILPSQWHHQALRRMRHLHWHSLARSRVSRYRIRQWPNLWTSYCFTMNPYPNSTLACRDSLVTTPQTSLLKWRLLLLLLVKTHMCITFRECVRRCVRWCTNTAV